MSWSIGKRRAVMEAKVQRSLHVSGEGKRNVPQKEREPKVDVTDYTCLNVTFTPRSGTEGL